MSEWLTTGQMIDRAKENEIVVNDRNEYFIKHSYGFVLCDEKGYYVENITLKINDVSLSAKWRILPKYVSFEEAMNALKEHKYVRWHYPNDKNITIRFNRNHTFDKFTESGVSIDNFIDGKWSIED